MTIGLDKRTQLPKLGLTQALAFPRTSNRRSHRILRGGDAQWVALSIRPRVVMMRKDSGLTEIGYEDLADPQWRGKLCMRTPLHQNNVALISAYLLHHGAEATEAWLNGLKANPGPRADAQGQRRNPQNRPGQLCDRHRQYGGAGAVAGRPGVWRMG